MGNTYSDSNSKKDGFCRCKCFKIAKFRGSSIVPGELMYKNVISPEKIMSLKSIPLQHRKVLVDLLPYWKNSTWLEDGNDVVNWVSCEFCLMPAHKWHLHVFPKGWKEGSEKKRQVIHSVGNQLNKYKYEPIQW